jgi:hypothetical protein
MSAAYAIRTSIASARCDRSLSDFVRLVCVNVKSSQSSSSESQTLFTLKSITVLQILDNGTI